MTREEFRSLPFAEARAKLLEEMGLSREDHPNIAHDMRTAIYVTTETGKSLWPLRSGREG